MSKKCLIVVDAQNDFASSGPLSVPKFEEIISPINRLIEQFDRNNDSVFFTQDWHPSNHCSFQDNGGLWPKHCVQWTRGAQIHPSINVNLTRHHMFHKGFVTDSEEYSPFYDVNRNRLYMMLDTLEELKIESLYICGVALDYCVKETAADAVSLGFRTTIMTDACRGIDRKSSMCALDMLLNAGVGMSNSYLLST